MTMGSCSADSPPSKKLVQLPLPIPDDRHLVPRPLRINKRKRQPSQHSCTARTNLPTDGLVPAVKVRRAATMSYPPTFLSSPSTRNRDIPTDPSRSSRAVTVGTISSHQFSPNLLKLSHSSIQGRTRPSSTRKSSPDSNSAHTVRRLPSFRHQILSRVMNGLIGRSSSGQTTADEHHETRLSTDGSVSNGSTAPAADERTSFPTTERSSSTGSNLETALSEFPEPPSAVPTTLSAFYQTRVNFQAYRQLHEPTETTIVRPDILMTPEYGSVDSNRNPSLCIAVEVSAVTGACNKTQDSHSYGLDIVIIIDNSWVNLFAYRVVLADGLQAFCISGHSNGEL
ncbi:MAG: hypothetical protein Q9176_007334 [Flavoplaca citrina]